MAQDSGSCFSIELLKEDARNCWRGASAEMPGSLARYSAGEQADREHDLDHRMEEAEAAAAAVPPASRKQASARLIVLRGRLQKSIVQFLHSFDCDIGGDMEGDFSAVMDDFIREAYEFDPAVSQEDVYQASRNVLIMNSFQMHLGKAVRLTPSVFAYSMLYPVTDNYLDSADISTASKQEANNRLRMRLMGAAPRPRNRHERHIDALVHMIEAEYDRRGYPLVYESLLAIHRAQCRSVGQQHHVLPADELLDISLEKGGTSVLADGYLAAGSLCLADAEFIFRFGVLLQLIDDLQDIGEDGGRGHQTLAVQAAESGNLEAFTNRLMSLIDAVVPPRASDGTLHRLISRSCRLLILEAVASAPEFYTAGYLRRLEHHAPVRLDYLRRMKSTIRERRNFRMDHSALYGLGRTKNRTAA